MLAATAPLPPHRWRRPRSFQDVCTGCRPYERLADYALRESKPQLTWKMQTTKRGGCDGQHCDALSKLGSYRCGVDRCCLPDPSFISLYKLLYAIQNRAAEWVLKGQTPAGPAGQR